MDSLKTTDSIYKINPSEPEDDYKFEHSQSIVSSLIKSLSSREIHQALNVYTSKGSVQYEEVILGLLRMILSSSNSELSSSCFQDLLLISRDGLQLVISRLSQLTCEKWSKMLDLAKRQVVWLLERMIKAGIANSDHLLLYLLKQMIGGDTSPNNVWLIESILDVVMANEDWLKKQVPFTLASLVYNYLRLIQDHFHSSFEVLRQKEVHFCVRILREKWSECQIIGRDLVLNLICLARIPQFDLLWQDILNNPSSLSPKFTGVKSMLLAKTSRRLISLRLTHEMENKLIFYTSKVRFGSQKRYEEWLSKYFMNSNSITQTLRQDWIRYLCCIIHPANEILASDVIQRWYVIGWLLSSCPPGPSLALSQLCLFFDWFFFDPEKDSIMNIEPAILLMSHSVRLHPEYTLTLLDFLCRSILNFFPSLCDDVSIIKSTTSEKSSSPDLPLQQNHRMEEDVAMTEIHQDFDESCESLLIDETFSDDEEEIEANHDTSSCDMGSVKQQNDEMAQPKIDFLETLSTKSSNFVSTLYKHREFILKRHLNDSKKAFFTSLNGIEDEEPLNDNMEKNRKVSTSEKEINYEAQIDLLETLFEIIDKKSLTQTLISSSHLSNCIAEVYRDYLLYPTFPEMNKSKYSKMDDIFQGHPIKFIFQCLSKAKVGLPENKERFDLLVYLISEIHHNSPNSCLGFLLLLFLSNEEKEKKGLELYMQCYKIHASVSDCSQHLLKDIELCAQVNSFIFMHFLLPALLKCTLIHKALTNNASFIHIIVSHLNTQQILKLYRLNHSVLFIDNHLSEALVDSLSWEGYEQTHFWKLLSIFRIDIKTILDVLIVQLNFSTHCEAIDGLLTILRDTHPCVDLLRVIFTRTSPDEFVYSVLCLWCNAYYNETSEVIATCIANYDRRSRNRTNFLSLNTILSHLQFYHMRQSDEDDIYSSPISERILNNDLVRAALQQAQQLCSATLKSKYSDLFLLAQSLDDDDEVEEEAKLQMGAGKGSECGRNNNSSSIPTYNESPSKKRKRIDCGE